MALDRTNREMPYVTGRMIAIVEHYASNRFGQNTIPTMFSHPAHGVDVFRRYVDDGDEYYQELKDIKLPVTTKNEIEKGQIWIGYQHQKSEYGDLTTGGYRPNSGRPANDRSVQLLVRITKEAANKLSRLTSNKSEYIDRLIKEQPE